MSARTLTAMIEDAFDRSPTRPFLASPGGGRTTYAEARDRAAQLARVLADHGVGPGDRVAVQVEKSPQSVFLYLACLRAGAVFVPVNTAYTEPEVDYLLGDVEPSLVVRDPLRPPLDRELPTLTLDERGGGSLAEAAAGEAVDFEAAAPGPDDPAAILYTSGTTGRPKGAVLSQANLRSNAEGLCETWQFDAGDVLLHALPLFHTHGLFVATNCVLASHASLILLPRFEVGDVLEHLGESSVFMGIPTFYTRLLADPRLDRSLCRGVRLFTSGSAPLPASVHTEFRARTGHAIVERYGLTETSILTSNPVGRERPGTVGLPLPGVDLRVVEQEPPTGEQSPGSIEVRGPNVFGGYWRRPDATRTEFTPDGYFRTGDLGTVDAEGYLTIVGRSKDLIITGGYNVYPKEVEDVLGALEGVAESAVVGVPDGDLGERVVAVVVARPGAAVNEERVRAGARRTLAGYKVPKSVHFVDSLPRNAMGKVEKARIRDGLAEGQRA